MGVLKTGVYVMEIEGFKTDEYFLQSEWVVNIQVPFKAVDEFARVLGEEIPLIQGNYSHCVYVRDNGRCRFKGNEGAHGGAEETIQEVPSSEVIISIPQEYDFLKRVLAVINKYHVHEEPTVRITEALGFRSLYNSDAENPNKYWNRDDKEEIHGLSLK